MAEFPALPLWTDAYLADTTHLSTLEHGAYFLLLMTAWRTPNCRLPDDDHYLAKVCRCSDRVWIKLRPTMARFWTIEGGYWSQKRLTAEREFCKRVQRQRVNAAHAMHRKRKDTADAAAHARHMHPHPHLDKEEESKILSAPTAAATPTREVRATDEAAAAARGVASLAEVEVGVVRKLFECTAHAGANRAAIATEVRTFASALNSQPLALLACCKGLERAKPGSELNYARSTVRAWTQDYQLLAAAQRELDSQPTRLEGFAAGDKLYLESLNPRRTEDDDDDEAQSRRLG